MWEVGQALKPLKKPPFTPEQLIAYGAASRDSNPIHLDEDFAKRAGFPSVIVHGMLSMAYLGDLVRMNFPEGQFRLVRIKARFRKVTFPGDSIACEGVVKMAEAGRISVAVSARNQNGELMSDGEADLEPL